MIACSIISLSAADYDSDGDLDLALAGVGGSNPIKLFNNTFSEYVPSQPPDPIDSEFIHINYSDNDLFISWNATTDPDSPDHQLSYNLQVEKINGDILLSGRYPLSTHPAQGYRGNRRFNTNFTLHNVSTGSVRIKVQAIDNGLAHSDWTIKEFNDCTPPDLGSWVIDHDCSLTGNINGNVNITLTHGATLEMTHDVLFGYNTSITIDNGTLLVFPSVNIEGNHTSIRFISGDLQMDDTQIKNVNLSIYSPVNFSNVSFDKASLAIHNKTIATDCNYTGVTFSSDHEFINQYEVDFVFNDQYGSVLSQVRNDSELFISPLNLTGFIINASNQRTHFTHLFNFSKKYYYPHVLYFTPNSSATKTVILRRTPEPLWDVFQMGATTNFSALITGNETKDRERFSALENVTIANTNAEVVFHGPINLTEKNLSEWINFSENSVFVSHAFYPVGNATITILNVSYSEKPVILKDDNPCSDCIILSYSGNKVQFNATGFSAYSTHANSEITFLNSSYLPFNESLNLFFDYHNYSNRSDTIAASCNISTPELTSTPMTFNPSIGYNYTLKYSDPTLLWNTTWIAVQCSGHSSFESLEKNFSVTLIDEGAWFIKEQEYPGVVWSSVFLFNNALKYTGIDVPSTHTIISNDPDLIELYDSSVSVSDINNDGNLDLVALGNRDSEAVFYYEINNTRAYLDPLTKGSLAVFDFDNDGDLDLVACGEDAAENPTTMIYENRLAQNHFRKIAFEKVYHTLPHLKDCSVAYGDVDLDNKTDFVIQGSNALDIELAHLVAFNGSHFTIDSNFEGLGEGEVFLLDYDSDGTLDLLTTGEGNQLNKAIQVYTNNGTDLVQNQTLSNQLSPLKSSAVVYGLVDQNLTLILIGEGNDNIIAHSYVFNGSAFLTTQASIQVTGITQGSALLYDEDTDGDLDLFVTGKTINQNFVSHRYANTQPAINLPPTTPTIQGAYNNETHTLSLNWTEAAIVSERFE